MGVPGRSLSNHRSRSRRVLARIANGAFPYLSSSHELRDSRRSEQPIITLPHRSLRARFLPVGHTGRRVGSAPEAALHFVALFEMNTDCLGNAIWCHVKLRRNGAPARGALHFTYSR